MNKLQECLLEMELNKGPSKSIVEGPRDKPFFEKFQDLPRLLYSNGLSNLKDYNYVEKVPKRSSRYVEQFISDKLDGLVNMDKYSRQEISQEVLSVGERFEVSKSEFIYPLLEAVYMNIVDKASSYAARRDLHLAEMTFFDANNFLGNLGFECKSIKPVQPDCVLNAFCETALNSSDSAALLREDYVFALSSASRLGVVNTKGMVALRNKISFLEDSYKY